MNWNSWQFFPKIVKRLEVGDRLDHGARIYIYIYILPTLNHIPQ